MIEKILPFSGIIAVVSAISMIITPGFVSGVYKTDTPISGMKPTSFMGKVFIAGLIIAGGSQSLFAWYLLRDFDLHSQKMGLGICVIAGICCALLAIFRGNTHPYTHSYLAKAYFCLALSGGLFYQVFTILKGREDIAGLLLVWINIIGTMYLFLWRNSKFWAEIWGISLILMWYLHFYL